jgi:starch-binding outer membrane protein, SusD/RagB family
MKKIKYIITVFILSTFIFSSCENVLDVSPTVELADEVALNSTVGLQSALMGAYDKLQNGYLYGGRYWVSTDMIAGTVKISGLQNTVFEELQMLNKTMSGQSNQIVQVTWQVSYEAIGIINRLLEYLPTVNDADMTDDVRERIEGEAKFIRAIVFFELTRLYSYDVQNLGPLAVPIFTEALGPFDQPPRASVEDAYDQIILDLQDATTLLEGKNTQGRASAVAAQAYLSRVNFYKGDWGAVETAANYVINKFTGQPNGGLADDVLDCFTAGSPDPEVLFAVLASGTDDATGTFRGYFRLASNAKFSIDGSYLGKIGTHVIAGDDDARARVDHAFVNVEGKVYTTKFDIEYHNAPVIRLAEVYLNRAEARVNLGRGADAALDLNVVRNRSGVRSLTGNATLANCETERTIELNLEGDYLHNMIRLQKANFAKDIQGNRYNWDDVRLKFPIPKSQLDVNSNLVQNI